MRFSLENTVGSEGGSADVKLKDGTHKSPGVFLRSYPGPEARNLMHPDF